VAKSNCGIPEFVKDEIHYTGTPELMADYARMALDVGARIIGGCCGTTPMHLAAMHEALKDYEKGPRPSLEQIVDSLGAISTGATEQQQAGGLLQRPKREGRRRGRRRDAGSEETPRF
nr:homocysteine S-methyltransferase family protein [Kiloniellales bacterium]